MRHCPQENKDLNLCFFYCAGEAKHHEQLQPVRMLQMPPNTYKVTLLMNVTNLFLRYTSRLKAESIKYPALFLDVFFQIFLLRMLLQGFSAITAVKQVILIHLQN